MPKIPQAAVDLDSFVDLPFLFADAGKLLARLNPLILHDDEPRVDLDNLPIHVPDQCGPGRGKRNGDRDGKDQLLEVGGVEIHLAILRAAVMVKRGCRRPRTSQCRRTGFLQT